MDSEKLLPSVPIFFFYSGFRARMLRKSQRVELLAMRLHWQNFGLQNLKTNRSGGPGLSGVTPHKYETYNKLWLQVKTKSHNCQ